MTSDIITPQMFLSRDGWMGGKECWKCAHHILVGSKNPKPLRRKKDGTVNDPDMDRLMCRHNPIGIRLYGWHQQLCGMYELDTVRYATETLESYKVRAMELPTVKASADPQTRLEAWL